MDNEKLFIKLGNLNPEKTTAHAYQVLREIDKLHPSKEDRVIQLLFPFYVIVRMANLNIQDMFTYLDNVFEEGEKTKNEFLIGFLQYIKNEVL